MKYLKNLLASFLIGVGIGSIIEIFISLAIGEITLGVPEFLNGQDSLLKARIIEINKTEAGIVMAEHGGKSNDWGRQEYR